MLEDVRSMEGLGDIQIGDPCLSQRALLDGSDRSGRDVLAECTFQQAHENRTLRAQGVSGEDFGADLLQDCGPVAFNGQLDTWFGRVADERNNSLASGERRKSAKGSEAMSSRRY